MLSVPLAYSSFAAAGAGTGTPWEVAIVFLGSQEDSVFQRAIDKNIKEILSVETSSTLKISVHRETPTEDLEYLDNRTPTVTARSPEDSPILATPEKLKMFLNKAFRNPSAKRFFAVYGHGFAFDGFREVSLRTFNTYLGDAAPLRLGDTGSGTGGSKVSETEANSNVGRKPFDLLWLDACFMSNIETLFELRKLSDYIVASEESEFTAGAPFQELLSLSSGPDDTKAISSSLAESYLESYSSLEKGSQHRAVYSSSATISVVDTSRLDGLVQLITPLTADLGTLTAEQKKAVERATKKIKMEKQNVVDLGTLLIGLKAQKSIAPSTKTDATRLIGYLDLNHAKRIKTNPRLRVVAPANDQLLVFGYENWLRGYQGDKILRVDKFPSNQKPSQYVAIDPQLKKWPARMVHIRLDLNPFSVGLKTFNFFFMDPSTGKPTSPLQSFERTQDYFFFESESSTNPIIATGYTQGIGAAAEHYTGLSILSPMEDQTISLEYPDLEFEQVTGWGK